MATVNVRFKEGNNKAVYSYKYNPIYDQLAAGDTVIVDSPRNGYVTADVISIEAKDRPAATKRIVSKVYDVNYKRFIAQDIANANEENNLRERVRKLPKAARRQLLDDYEDVI